MSRIEKMLEMQKALDKEIEKAHNVEFDGFKLFCAIIDEIGELNHELKAEWCWWKKNQNPVDRNKLLEELVDLWHFGLMFHYQLEMECEDSEEEMIEKAIEFRKITKKIHWKKSLVNNKKYKLGTYQALVYSIFNKMFSGDGTCVINTLVTLTYILEFTMDDVYNMYIKKNKINYERIKNNY